jgi:deazaflavin-dependent oxidoreductase (nitroreductase family)
MCLDDLASKEIRGEREWNHWRSLMTDPEFLKKLALTREVEITVTGRKSRRSITTPVWFLQGDQKMYLVPVKGTNSSWYKNVLAEPTMQISAGGRKVAVKASPISDSHKLTEVVEKLRSKYGAAEVKKYYSKLDAALEIPL